MTITSYLSETMLFIGGEVQEYYWKQTRQVLLGKALFWESEVQTFVLLLLIIGLWRSHLTSLILSVFICTIRITTFATH